MALLKLYDRLVETQGSEKALRYLALVGGAATLGLGVGLIGVFLATKPQQPVIIINQPIL